MLDDITVDKYVKRYAANMHYIARDDFEAYMNTRDVNDNADPIIAYAKNGKIIGWYDVENRCGYNSVL